ncbi:hypothetical protein [Rufibacter latericius]|uniref:Uncharacterized protein n=1 Tax=Rufibacter latericius TaxID=2487040 RepID=A0A3M9MG40_9BACT|nr:hypothetical protein [Rufibacter latericius]RNI24522.1 hypothetical protein EFB08_16540 [Rufibacter latericius]
MLFESYSYNEKPLVLPAYAETPLFGGSRITIINPAIKRSMEKLGFREPSDNQFKTIHLS